MEPGKEEGHDLDEVRMEAVSIIFEMVQGWVSDLLLFLKRRGDNPPLQLAERIAEDTGVSLDRVFNYLHKNWEEIVAEVGEVFEDAELFIEEKREEEKGGP